ncbi:hypothetical protein DPMN_081199 [Dreissena polymorpha]|uniref:Uncharacterized protein n=1 Tax=Dreissena polymorpha TaxID=45954 RepID=A0A9D4BGA9_DREPO|nr:hypothetical protein DPMN_081199 [Dreissena polymorpha]
MESFDDREIPRREQIREIQMRIDEDSKEKKRTERKLRNKRAIDNNDAREDSARIIQQYERDYTDESERFSYLSELNTIDEFLNEST